MVLGGVTLRVRLRALLEEHLSECREDGWDSHGGAGVTDAAIEAASLISFVPLSSGGIQLEVHAGGLHVEVGIGPDGRIEAEEMRS